MYFQFPQMLYNEFIRLFVLVLTLPGTYPCVYDRGFYRSLCTFWEGTYTDPGPWDVFEDVIV